MTRLSRTITAGLASVLVAATTSMHGQATANPPASGTGVFEEPNLVTGVVEGARTPEPDTSPPASAHPSSMAASSPDHTRVLVDIFRNETCGPDAVVGTFDVMLVTAPDRERLLRTEQRCTPVPWLDGAEMDGSEAAGLSAVEARAIIRELLPVPRPGLSPDPEHGSLTGLETRLWYADDGKLGLEPTERDGSPTLGTTLTDRAGPYEISASVWIQAYRWELGDGAVRTAGRPGHADDPAATHVYRTKSDDYTVTAATVWHGTYTWTAPGTSGQGDLGTLTITSEPVPYPVREVRAVPADSADR